MDLFEKFFDLPKYKMYGFNRKRCTVQPWNPTYAAA
jgi:hypothetical protein